MIYPIRNDRRYTIKQEYTGHASANPQWVIRFCGEWVDSRATKGAAIIRAVGHNAARMGNLVITEA